MTYQYIAGVTLRENVETYVKRDADEQLYQQLIAGNICNIFNSRKMGKSSLAVRTTKRLREEAGYLCVTLDISGDGSELDSRDQWYDGMLDTLTSELDLDIDLYSWLDIHARLSKPKQFRKFIETVIFPQTTQNIVIFLDEIDSILSFKLPTGEKLPTDDFFAFIRSLYNLRASKPEYQRLNFCLLGVVTASDLIEDSRRTPFNVGEAIELKGFTYQQAAPFLQRGLEGKFQKKSEQVLRDILFWTDGQPFLTQKLCKLALENADATKPNIAELVQTYVIDNWEAQDNPELLRTIRKRIINNDQFQYNLTSRLLGIYQQILEQGRIAFDNSREHRELQLSGLVVKKNSHLEVYNRIYAQVFNRDWVQQELEKLCCPFREYLNSWIGSNREDTTQLLQGNDLEEGLSWSQRKRLSDEMNDFLTESQIYDRQQLKQAKEKATKIIQLAQKGTQLERKGIQTLRLFNTTIDQRQTLRDAIQAGEDLQQLQAEWRELVQDDPELLKQTPAASPVFTLPEILSHIRQWRQLTGHSSSVMAVAFSPGGEYLATASDDKTAKLWNLQGEELITFTGHSGSLWGVAFSPGGEFIATASGDKTAKLWNLQGEELITFTGHSNGVTAVTFSPGGEFLATASWDKTAKLWNLQGEELITFTGHSDSVWGVVFSQGGEFLATASWDKTAKLWNLQGEELITFTGHSNQVTAVAFSPVGEFLATASWDNTTKLWNLQGRELITFTGHSNLVTAVAFSPGGEFLATVSDDNTAKLWNLQGQELITFTGHSNGLTGVTFSPGGEFLVTASDDKTTKLWNLQGESLITFTSHSYAVTGVAFSPGGEFIATASDDNTAKLWNLQGESLITFTSHSDGVTGVTFSPGGEFIATASADKTAKLWNLQGRELITFAGHSNGVTAVVFSPDGEYLVTASHDKTAKLWNLQGEELITFTGHSDLVMAVAFSPGGEYLATASRDGTVKVWDLQGNLLADFRGYKGNLLQGEPDFIELKRSVWSVCFSPDGKQIVAGYDDGKVRFWRFESLAELIARGKAWLGVEGGN